MDERAPDGDTTEGMEPVSEPASANATGRDAVVGLTDDLKVVTVSPDTLQRIVRWTRTVTVTGPEEWVTNTRRKSLAEGVHVMGIRGGMPCTIEVVATDAESLRGIKGDMKNDEMVLLRQGMPEYYEKIHGPGTAREHSAADGAPQRPTVTVDHTGQYL